MKTRLGSSKTADSEDADFFLELDTHAKIDKKFQYFCKNYSFLWQNNDAIEEEAKPLELNKTSSGSYLRSVLRKQAVQPEKQKTPFAYPSGKTFNFSKKNEKFHSIIKKISRCDKKEESGSMAQLMIEENLGEKKRLEQTVKQIYEDNYQNGVISPARKKMGEFFGNAVIAAFIEALINLSADEVQRMKMASEKSNNFNIPPWLARSYGISYSILQKFNTIDEKQNYVISCMHRTIDSLIEKWKVRHSTRSKANDEENTKLNNLKMASQNQKKDQFSWLNVKTNFDHLKKNLRALIVEKLNHYENQEKVVSALLKRSSDKQDTQKNNPSANNLTQTILSKIPSLPTNQILQNMRNDSKISAENFWETANQFYDTKNIPKTVTKLPNYRLPSSHNKSQTLMPTKKEAGTQLEEKFVFSDELKDIFSWKPEREKEFQRTRLTVKAKYVKNINVSNWYELAFLPMVQEINLDFKRHQQRDLKLQKFGEGESLSAEDLKFIVDTSDLLNSCVDRKFLQDAVDIIDEEVIRNLELYLAESILLNYEEIKSVIKESRLRYLEEKNKASKDKTEQRRIKEEQQQRIEENRKANRRAVVMFRTICEKIERNGVEKKNDETKKEGGVGKKKDEVRRTFHPPSKVMTTSAYEKNDIYDEDRVKKIQEINQKIAENYKLNLHSPIQLKTPNNFVNFYSGGPAACKLPEKEIREIKFTPSDLSKIIKIQSNFRRFKTRKLLENLKIESEKQRFQHLQAAIITVSPQKSSTTQKKVKIMDRSREILSPMTKSQMSSLIMDPPSSAIKPFETLNIIPNLSTQQSSKSAVNLTSLRKKTNDSSMSRNSLIARARKNAVRVEKLFDAVKKNRFNAMAASGQIYDKVDVNERDERGNTPLYYAGKNGSFEFSKFLIDLGANLNETCSKGDTPMHMACASNNMDVIMLFIQHKASFNAVNNNGLTPLANLTEGNLKRLDLTEGIVSLNRKHDGNGNGVNNDGLLVKGKKHREPGEVFLMHSFGRMVHHHSKDEGKGRVGVSSFRSGEWETTQMESFEEGNGKGRKKISFGENDEKLI